MNRAAACAAAVWIASAGAAYAEAMKACDAVDIEPANAIDFARVAPGTAKVNFVKGGKAGPSCPSADEACKDRSFLVAGDLVMIQKAPGDWVCAEYTSPKDFTTAGFLPAAALVPAEPMGTRLEAWLGRWRTGQHQEIEIVRGAKPGELSASGEATWGEDDPARVKNGGVHFGEFSASATPHGPILELASGMDGSKPFDSNEEYLCKLRLQLYGKRLLAEDNGNCGGMNVSFYGTYTRGRR